MRNSILLLSSTCIFSYHLTCSLYFSIRFIPFGLLGSSFWFVASLFSAACSFATLMPPFHTSHSWYSPHSSFTSLWTTYLQPFLLRYFLVAGSSLVQYIHTHLHVSRCLSYFILPQLQLLSLSASLFLSLSLSSSQSFFHSHTFILSH